MSKSKSIAATKRGTDPNPKYLGTKVSDGQKIKAGSILVKQKGTKFLAGKNVETGRNYTLFALKNGKVKFKNASKRKYDGKRRVVPQIEII